MKQKKRIKDLPLSKRPREKLLEKGKENLSDGELLAILLGSGVAKKNALELARQILKKHSIRDLHTINLPDLIAIPGVGLSKAARIVAGLELGARAFSPSPLSSVRIATTQDVIHQVKDIAHKQQEHLVVLYLNARQELIANHTVSLGRLNMLQVEPRDILRPAFSTPCQTIILVHNHPSGDPSPSEDDVRFTVRIAKATDIMGIEVKDHVIVSPTKYFSFRDEKLVFT